MKLLVGEIKSRDIRLELLNIDEQDRALRAGHVT